MPIEWGELPNDDGAGWLAGIRGRRAVLGVGDAGGYGRPRKGAVGANCKVSVEVERARRQMRERQRATAILRAHGSQISVWGMPIAKVRRLAKSVGKILKKRDAE